MTPMLYDAAIKPEPTPFFPSRLPKTSLFCEIFHHSYTEVTETGVLRIANCKRCESSIVTMFYQWKIVVE